MKYIANPVEVTAAQIAGVEPQTGNVPSGHVTCIMYDATRVVLTPEQTVRYSPTIGDYIVTQSDGYVYVNPKAIFERKYTRVSDAPC